MIGEAGVTAYWARALAVHFDDLTSIPATHMVEVENQLQKVVP